MVISSSRTYEPPRDFVQQRGSTADEFALSALENKELWLLRVPDNVPSSYLDGITIKLPSKSKNGELGELAVGSNIYSITTSTAGGGAESREMAEMNLLVPDDDDHDNSLLTLFPGHCTEHLSLVEKIDIPDAVAYAQEIATREPVPRPQPVNMKMRFIPYGFYSAEEHAAMNQSESVITDLPDEVHITAANTVIKSVDSGLAEPSPKRRKKRETKETLDDSMDIDSKAESSNNKIKEKSKGAKKDKVKKAKSKDKEEKEGKKDKKKSKKSKE
ncbi:hypothetical protein H4R24_003845 [Coemansia sp. RSA 988]|nr:hypothetical protein H4R24_003845 [Coemansia sp. RSA 988]